MAWTIAVIREGLQRSLVSFPGLEGGDGAFAAAADPGVGLVHGLLPARQLRPLSVPLERVRTEPPAP